MKEIEIATRGWTLIGDTTNSRFFEVRPAVLCAVPRSGAVDDKKTSLENRAFQEAYFRRIARPGVVIVLMDGFVSQDNEARGVYQNVEEPLVRGIALVASSLLGRAIMSFSIGLRRLRVVVKPFGTVEEALGWADSFMASIDAPKEATS
jgi:hypothetical protein